MSALVSAAIWTRWSDARARSAAAATLLIMQSNGGMYDLDGRSKCIQMMESGPAAGVAGTQVLCGELGTATLICFDMGGTTAKACVIANGAEPHAGLFRRRL